MLATISAESKEEFWGPLQRFLTGEGIGGMQALRWARLDFVSFAGRLANL